VAETAYAAPQSFALCEYKEPSMSLNFYDSTGRPYAYSDDGESIYTFDGAPIAYIDGDSIYGFNGTHIGYFKNGLIRDSRGGVALFTDNASGGPIKPIKQIKPIKSIKQIKPIKSIKAIRPIRPIDSMCWSQYSPEDLFEG
jgi:hypothetical protein